MRTICCLLSVICMMACGCNNRKAVVCVEGEDEFRDGDLVLRCGLGAESRVVTETSRSPWSHIGLLRHDPETGRWMVVHAVSGEAEGDEPEYLKCEPLNDFYHPQRAKSGSWMRVDCADSVAQRAAAYALSKVEQKLTFDNDYQLSDTTAFYCTELVWQSYIRQGIDLSDGRRHDIPRLFSKDGECIFPSDIENSQSTLFVKPFKTISR